MPKPNIKKIIRNGRYLGLNREELAMAQLYLQRFEYRAATKPEFDQTWASALQTFAKTGNWGGAEAGIRHAKATERPGAAMS